ncbi:hypothetical protein HDU93_003771 [Gonapodya sp. JEL0774]|nr:hypothetical protein HDU93_003771 [Gonapodya sp. JEL0774]
MSATQSATASTESEVPPTPPRHKNPMTPAHGPLPGARVPIKVSETTRAVLFANATTFTAENVVPSAATAPIAAASDADMDDQVTLRDIDEYNLFDPVLACQSSPTAEEWAAWDEAHAKICAIQSGMSMVVEQHHRAFTFELKLEASEFAAVEEQLPPTVGPVRLPTFRMLPEPAKTGVMGSQPYPPPATLRNKTNRRVWGPGGAFRKSFALN